jgi:hypothetical protein
MMNMKKKYQKPEIEVIEFEMDVYMLDSSIITDGGEAGDDEDATANRHRGEWGNLWAED